MSRTNEMTIREQRPWVNIEFNHKDFFGPDSPDHNGVFACKIKYRLKNEGKTPAFNVGGIIKVFEHDAPRQLVRHAKSLAENLRITLMHDQSSVLFPSEIVEAEDEKVFFLEKGQRSRQTSLVIMVIYDLDQSTDAKGVYIRCFTLNATYERGVKTNEVIPHEEIEARVVL